MKMIFFAIVLLAATQAHGQDGYTTIGFKFGMLSSSLRGVDADTLTNGAHATLKWGITAGVVVNSRLKKYFWLKHELVYTVRTMGVTLQDATTQNYSTSYTRHYFDIFPLSPTFHFKGLQIYAGPYLAVLSQAWVDRKDSQGHLFKDYSIFGSDKQFSKQHQKLDAGVAVGIEYEFPFGINLGAKYIVGFVPVVEYANANTFNDPNTRVSAYNNSLNLTLGYSFVKKREPVK